MLAIQCSDHLKDTLKEFMGRRVKLKLAENLAEQLAEKVNKDISDKEEKLRLEYEDKMRRYIFRELASLCVLIKVFIFFNEILVLKKKNNNVSSKSVPLCRGKSTLAEVDYIMLHTVKYVTNSTILFLWRTLTFLTMQGNGGEGGQDEEGGS